MITAELMGQFRDAGFENICQINGEWLLNDGTPLTAQQLEIVTEILEGKTPQKRRRKPKK